MAMRLGGFGTRPTRRELELVARDATANRPAVQARGNIAMMRWQVTDALPRLNVPALVFTGGKDIVTLPRAGELITKLLPQARQRSVPKAGHLGPIEFADEYARMILDFADAAFTRGARSADGRTPAQDPSPSPRRSGLDGGRPHA
jgi:pimeloyl-ACP methyl ester carboxylesterase